jgi:hypothetical protein
VYPQWYHLSRIFRPLHLQAEIRNRGRHRDQCQGWGHHHGTDPDDGLDERVMLGGIVSLRVFAPLIRGGFLVAPAYPQDAYPALGIGTACLIVGIGRAILVQAKAVQRSSKK